MGRPREEIDELVKQGSLAKWSEVADVPTQPRPRMVLPLGVEPSKPRLFWDDRYLNLMCTHMPFAMDSVGKVAQCSWFGAHQVTLDHKSGFHHVALDAESWQYFGLCWQGVYYVFTVLGFGWCSSPYIYHTLSSVVGQYLRARDTPVLVWIDDFYLSNFRSTKSGTPQAQFRAAQAATYLALSVFYKAGYFMSASKCVLTPTTRLVFLGVVCDTTLRRFEVPQDKLDKLEQILNGVVETGSIYFATFEKLAGKCTSMSVAVPPAALYTHFMYKKIGEFRRKGGFITNTEITVSRNSGLRSEVDKWLEVRHRMNGAPWYRAAHHVISLNGATDASSGGWGGLVRGPESVVFEAAGDFPDEWSSCHINVQEAYALLETLNLFCAARPLQLAGSKVVIDVDNKTLYYAFRRGKAKESRMHDIIVQLFWLQVDADFTLELRWVCSEENKEADDLSRPGAEHYAGLESKLFGQLWQT